MLKNFISGFFALTMLAAIVPVQPVSANGSAAPIVIDNVLDLCQNLLNHGDWLDDSGTCDAFTSTQTAATIVRLIYIRDDIILKNLNLTFLRPNSPFIIRDGGRLTIDGGHYTSPNCVVWIQYDNNSTPGYYVPTTTIQINSGVFEATVETMYSAEAPSPVCVSSRYPLTAAETASVINNYLPTGRRFVDVAPRLRTLQNSNAVSNEIPSDDGFAHTDKVEENRETIKYLKTTMVAVVGDEGQGGEEPVSEEPETPEPAKTEEPTVIIPKAPNTAIAR
ncbi:hypothetical protein IKE86_01360 [Candidatus Saccharibacteria bacterium]|nr:hypothetical protein [Candidatus Saccharibacteria bacterium]